MVEGYSWVPPGLPQVNNYESLISSLKNIVVFIIKSVLKSARNRKFQFGRLISRGKKYSEKHPKKT